MRPTTKGMELTAYSERATEVREVLQKMTEEQIWDTVQARDIDPIIIRYVEDQIQDGYSAGEICNLLSLPGGKAGRQWKKIAAHFRQGERANAEVYLYQQTHKLYKTIQKARDILEDAFENGTPEVVNHPSSKYHPASTEVVRVKGATKELATFLKAYSDAIALPVKLWKDYGAIGEEKHKSVAGVTIVVQNNIPFPSADEIKKHQEEIVSKATHVTNETLEVKSGE